MRVGSLFSGVGGFDLGFERAGFEVAWQCEIDKHARAVLARHWPGVRCYEDVREVGAGAPAVDVLVGGFPCQDASIMQGRHGPRGFGERTGLFFEALRIAEVAQPRVLVFENVKGLLSADGGSTFGAILQGLADVGYVGQWRVVDGAGFGLPHRREHLLIVGWATAAGGVPEGFWLGDCECGHPARRELLERARQSWSADGRPVAGCDFRLLTPEECERALGFPDGWTAPASNTSRYRQMGNAVAVPVAEWIARRILSAQEAR